MVQKWSLRSKPGWWAVFSDQTCTLICIPAFCRRMGVNYFSHCCLQKNVYSVGRWTKCKESCNSFSWWHTEQMISRNPATLPGREEQCSAQRGYQCCSPTLLPCHLRSAARHRRQAGPFCTLLSRSPESLEHRVRTWQLSRFMLILTCSQTESPKYSFVKWTFSVGCFQSISDFWLKCWIPSLMHHPPAPGSPAWGVPHVINRFLLKPGRPRSMLHWQKTSASLSLH